MPSFLWVIIIALIVLWAAGWLVFEIASGLLHLLLVVAVILIILHFVRSMRSRM